MDAGTESWRPAGRARRRVKRHATTRKAMSIEPETTEVTGTDVAEATAVDDAETVTEGQASRVDVQLALVEEYTCPICLEVLLRPVSLSCGHRLCRGCWLRVLQGRDVRATANRTGTVACPLGRCQVRPIVPAVDAALARDLESQFSSQLSTATLPEVDEAKIAAEVNAWAAGGCKLDHPEEKAWVEAVAQVEQAERCRMISQRFLLITVGLLACLELVVFIVFLTGMQAGWGWVQTPNLRAQPCYHALLAQGSRAWAWPTMLAFGMSAALLFSSCFCFFKRGLDRRWHGSQLTFCPPFARRVQPADGPDSGNILPVARVERVSRPRAPA